MVNYKPFFSTLAVFYTIILLLISGCGGGGTDSADNPDVDATVDITIPFLSKPETWLKMGESFQYLPLIDEQIESPFFTLETPASGMLIDHSTGLIDWTPSTGQTGQHDITLKVTSSDRSWKQTFVLTVSSEMELAAETFDSTGGKLSTNNITIDIPAGAVSENITFSLALQSGIPDIEPLTTIKVLGDVFSIRAEKADGTAVDSFNIPISVTIPYNPAQLPADLDSSDINTYLLDPRLEQLALYIESTVDPVNHTITFETPHLSDWLLGYWSESRFREVVNDDRFYVHYDYFNDPGKTSKEITDYCTKVLNAAQKAETIAKANSFSTPAGTRVDIRVHDDASGGHFDPLSGIIYIDWELDDNHIKTSTAHEYFHKVQDEYYVMNAAKITGKNWWYESTAPWFETKINTNALAERVKIFNKGYLRTPLFSSDRNDAYPKGTLIEFLEGKKPGFVQATFADNGVTNTLLGSIAKSVNLDLLYPEYVNWAMQKYGPGQSATTVDGTIEVQEDNNGIFWDNYNSQGELAGINGRQVLTADATTNVLSVSITELSATNSHRAFIHRIKPASINPGNTKTVKLKFSNSLSSSPAYILTRNRNKQPIRLETISANATTFHRIKRFGNGSKDTVGDIFLIYTDLTSGLAGQYEWQIEIIEQPEEADIEIDIPADGLQTSEVRTFLPEEFDFPTIAVDTSVDPDANSWAIILTGVIQDPFSLDAGWQVIGISLSDNPVTYGDPDIGEYNTAGFNIPGLPSDLLVKSLSEYSHFQIMAGTCEEKSELSCSFRGISLIKYVDGPVDFSFSIDPPQVVPRHQATDPYRIVPTTPVDITLTVQNDNSLPVVLNSLKLYITEQFEGYSNTLRDGNSEPFLVVNQGETKSYTFSNVELSIDPDTHGTIQRPRLYVEIDNCPSGDALNCGLTNNSLNVSAAFWSDWYSNPAELEILNPPTN